jgi:hypothetical protein
VTHFEFPDYAELRAEAALVEGLEIDDVAELGDRLVGRASREALGLDIGDGPSRATNLDYLTRLGKGG